LKTKPSSCILQLLFRNESLQIIIPSKSSILPFPKILVYESIVIKTVSNNKLTSLQFGYNFSVKTILGNTES